MARAPLVSILLGTAVAATGLVLVGGPGVRITPRAQPGRDHTTTPRPARASLTHAIARLEYHASPDGGVLQAPNRSQRFRTSFGPEGIRIRGREEDDEAPIVGLRLLGLARSGERYAVGPGSVRAAGSRVEIDRGQVVEWYVNSAEGLEQGFRLASRPPGDGDLALELALDGAQATLDGGRVVLASGSGRRLGYDHLAVVDADGRAVPARLELPSPTAIRIVVADSRARYPLDVDPLISEIPDAVLASDQAGAAWGASVSGAGDVNGDGYDDVIVGAPLFDAGQDAEGAAFLFLGSAAGIASGGPDSADGRIEADEAGAQLGFSVAAAGDVNGDGYDDVIVGAPTQKTLVGGVERTGGAYVFHGGAAGIGHRAMSSAETILEPSTNEGAFGGFGDSVGGVGDLNGDGYDDVAVGNSHTVGSAYGFFGSATGIADGGPETADTRVRAPFTEAGVVALGGRGDVDGDGYDDLVVGVVTTDFDGEDGDPIGVLIYRGGPLGPGDRSMLDADTTIGMWPDSVSMGDVNGDGLADVVASAALYGGTGWHDGAAFVFHGRPGGIPDSTTDLASTQIEVEQGQDRRRVYVSATGDLDGDGFDDLVVGAPAYDGGEEDEGAVLVFRGQANGIPDGDAASAWKRLERDQVQAGFGRSVAILGDLDGSGTDDLIAGAPGFDAPQVDAGATFVYLPEPSAGASLATACLAAFALATRRATRTSDPSSRRHPPTDS